MLNEISLISVVFSVTQDRRFLRGAPVHQTRLLLRVERAGRRASLDDVLVLQAPHLRRHQVLAPARLQRQARLHLRSGVAQERG